MHTPPLILVADDNADFREIVSAKLAQAGFWVAQAADGAEAVAKAETLEPDLILMDIAMPNENGTEAVLDLKRRPGAKDLKVAFFTNLADPWPGLKANKAAVAKEIGAAEFIPKSIDLDALVARVKALLAIS